MFLEGSRTSPSIYFKTRITLLEQFALSKIHYFALRDLPFRLESKLLTDALGSRSHKIMHTGKTFSDIFTTDIFNTAPNDARP